MPENNPLFDVVYLSEALEFLEIVDKKAAKKILFNINKSRYEWDKELFKKLGDTGIWEFRTRFNGLAYRLFAFWDKNKKSLVVATHGLVKKTMKTPTKEIEKAQTIMKMYLK